MENQKDFKSALINRTIPHLVLDQKWHRLFAIHGKTEEIKALEAHVNTLIANEARLNMRLKELKKLKGQLMNNIVQNMEGSHDEASLSLRERKQEENKRLIEETNQKLEECEEELAEIPYQIRKANEELMLLSMEYFYDKLRVNRKEAAEIEEWINQVRIDLKKNIIRKQNRDINNREIYEYLHDIFGAGVIDIFDIKYDDNTSEEST
jgi:DNA repair exonuclease SbcCD ATPase subunit